MRQGEGEAEVFAGRPFVDFADMAKVDSLEGWVEMR